MIRISTRLCLPTVFALAALFTLPACPPLRAQGAAPGGGRGAGASQLWQEPHGRYTIQIPTGWQVDTSQGNLKMTNGTNWATFDTSSNQGDELDVAINAASQMKPFVTGWTVANQGRFTNPRQHPAAGITANGMVNTRDGARKQTFVFATVGAGSGHFVTMTASALFADGRAPVDAIMAAFNSIRFAGE